MGKHSPVRGSRAYWHRSRAARLVPRMRSFKDFPIPGLGGYKVGMTHAIIVDDSEAPTKGQEVIRSITIIEIPPILVHSIVYLKKEQFGSRVLGEEVFKPSKELSKYFEVKEAKGLSDELKKQATDVRLHLATMPWKTGLKKTYDLFEISLGGANVQEKIEKAKNMLGKEIPLTDVFNEGDYIDVVGVTKGKGWQGVDKRFAVALNPHKATKARRHGGSLGGETQAKVEYTVPRAGQMGFHRRTERNKRILLISKEAEKVTPKGGFVNGKSLKGEYIAVEGSISGPTLRFVRLNKSNKASRKTELKMISTDATN
ncbi:50S ribosomal protein L3 [uncultured archaeon]|nr:50S ribosomal protein L3 [uncultured archaeon]